MVLRINNDDNPKMVDTYLTGVSNSPINGKRTK